MRLRILRAATVALAILALPSAADAEWLSGFSGHTYMNSPNPDADGVVNFAVYRVTDSDWTDDFGAAFQASIVSLTAPGSLQGNFVYFYQVVNTNETGGAGDHTLNSLYLRNGGTILEAGYANQQVFNEPVEGATGPTGNTRLGPNNTSIAGDVLDGVPTHSGTTPDGFVTNTGAGPTNSFEGLPPQVITFPSGSGVSGSAVRFNFTAIAPGTTTGSPYTSVMFVVSNAAPIYAEGVLRNSDASASGDIPVPSPEPGTLALLGLGLPLLGWGYARRQRASKAVAEATA